MHIVDPYFSSKISKNYVKELFVNEIIENKLDIFARG